MSVEKKVSLLILLLIALIVSCVYIHIEKIEKNLQENTQKSVSTQSKPENKTEEKEVEVKEEQQDTPEKNAVVNGEAKSNQEDSKPNETIKTEEKKVDETKPSFEKAEDEVLGETNKEEVREDVKNEVPKEPLVTTGKKYKRTNGDKRIEELSRNAQLLQIKITEFVKENPIIFRTGSNKLVKSSFNTIDTISNVLKEFPNIKIEVAGHTDAAGSRKLNQGISVTRAVVVKKLLIKNGITKKRIKARGYGEDIPLVKNNSNGYSKINRRVEFNIIGE